MLGPVGLWRSYELELRKSAYRYVRDNVCADIGTALAKACEAPALYGVHFVTPLQLGKLDHGDSGAWPPVHRFGKGEGKGEEQGQGSRHVGPPMGKKAASAPNGQRICFNFNKVSGCKKQRCDFCPCLPTVLRETFVPAMQVQGQ